MTARVEGWLRGDELLPTIDVVGRAREGRVGAKLIASVSSSSPKSDADNGVSTKPAAMRLTRMGRELEREVLSHRGKRGREPRDERESRRRASAGISGR